MIWWVKLLICVLGTVIGAGLTGVVMAVLMYLFIRWKEKKEI